MQPWETFFMQKRVERTIQALKGNNFEALFVPDAKAVLEEIWKHIPAGATVALGASVTLEQIGAAPEMERRKITLIRPVQAKNEEERLQLTRASFSADIFLTSTNAVTEDGKLFNIDNTGNRVGAMFIGPKKVLVVAGVNKIVKDEEAAVERVRSWVAPQNAKRTNKKTPCAVTGVCEDCKSPQRICNIFVTLRKKPSRTALMVMLVGENLGI